MSNITITDNSEQAITNRVLNFASRTEMKSLESVSSFGNVLKAKHLDNFNKSSNTLFTRTDNKIEILAKKYSIDNDNAIKTELDSTIDSSLFELFTLKELTSGNYLTALESYGNSIFESSKSAINEYTDKLSATVSGGSPSVIQAIKDKATQAISAMASKISTVISSLYNSFTSALSNVYNNALNKISALKTKFSNLTTAVVKKFESSKKVIYNFYQRAKGLASTSQYVQAKIPTATGELKNKVEALKNTPDEKIITPQLKKDVNTVKEFTKNPLAELLGFVGSLIPTVSQKKIEEPKPTGDKAEYGKIQVKETKGGFVEISDETPGNVRKINQHPSGSYNAMLNDGSVQNKITGDRQEICDGNWNIKTEKDKVEIVAGNNRIEIRKNETQTTIGNRNTSIDGVSNTVVKGNVSDDFKANYDGKIAGNYNEAVGGNRIEKTDGNLTETIGGNHMETVQGSLTIHVSGNVNIVSGGTTTVSSAGTVRISGPQIFIG